MIGPSRIVPTDHADACTFRTTAELDTAECPRCRALANVLHHIAQRSRRQLS